MSLKALVTTFGLAVIVCVCILMPQTVHAENVLISIDGVVTTNQGHPAQGEVVFIWCEDTHHFVGSDITDASGHYNVETTSDYCSFNSSLFADVYDENNTTIGSSYALTHTKTTVNIRIGEYNQFPVPEYGQIGAAMTLVASAGAIIVVRRRSAQMS